ncbi:MAG: oxidoreductase [Micavibrio aeruginosavorus]|uniref:Oxidoreductase n=1 Tax=Micavibrio aeruginosavorus TaxID=349221 RepID=A0A2W5FP38_9BACT|nr:MAG: oxidoreductase [Micavibrio aeruginosavorus]
MKAVLQNFKTGDMAVEDVPPPSLKADGVLVTNIASLVSAGTEKAVIELAKMNPLQKAKARPDLVKKVLSKAGQDGLLATARIVMNLVSAPLPLGYSCAGIVSQVGSRVSDVAPGQRVACAGLNYANHAEMVYIPRNLMVPIPDNVSYEEAAFVTVGSIALHGVRQAQLTLGETVVVIGMGLVGQIAAQICSASGCKVFCIDLDPSKIELAKSLGADDGMAGSDTAALKAAVMNFTGNHGADAVLITAGTKSSGPIELAPELSRDRARVVAIGDVGHNVPRRSYYEKEIDLRQSRSYGPGRYDPDYEERGHDYPLGYVRWTENRNMEAFLDLIAAGRVKVKPLLTHRFEIEAAQEAYDLLLGETKEPYIGIILDYDAEKDQETSVTLKTVTPSPQKKGGQISIGVIGAGQFAQGVLLPALKNVKGASFHSFATGSGFTSLNVARKYKAEICTSDYREMLADAKVDAVLIATRHDTHAEIVSAALKAGKHCFVEKPLAMDAAGLQSVIEAQKSTGNMVLTGFNRRFSPLAKRLKNEMAGAKLVMQYRINAGFIPGSHWHQDIENGGGRIVGEVCHFIDTMQYICGSDPVSVFAESVNDGNSPADPDNIIITFTFSDGSIGTIAYVASGDSGFPKERIEVFGGGRVGVIDNWRTLLVQGNGRKVKQRCWLQAEKGHRQEMVAFIDAVRSGQSPISFESQILTTQTTFAIQESLREGRTIQVTA